jgi:hypothetical protein
MEPFQIGDKVKYTSPILASVTGRQIAEKYLEHGKIYRVVAVIGNGSTQRIRLRHFKFVRFDPRAFKLKRHGTTEEIEKLQTKKTATKFVSVKRHPYMQAWFDAGCPWDTVKV